MICSIKIQKIFEDVSLYISTIAKYYLTNTALLFCIKYCYPLYDLFPVYSLIRLTTYITKSPFFFQ